jgi:hypothetical protein
MSVVAASLRRGASAVLLLPQHRDTRRGGRALPWLEIYHRALSN